MAKKDKRLWIDMCAGSELKDTQGETLSVDGADIDGLTRLNDNHGKGFFNSLGVVTESKKIFKAEDCENDRQKYYWEKIKAPYIYAKGYLHNDEDHPNARAAAAIIRNIHRDDVPLKIKASVEGGVLSRGISDPTRLARTKIHSVALTFTPANNATLVEPLSIDKSNTDWETDKQLIKSVIHLAETNVPSFRHIERHASAHTIRDNILKIQELAKSLGIEIEIKGGTPEEIMEKAVMHKIATNISKINDLVKAAKDYAFMKPTKPVGGSDIRAAADEARTGNIASKDKYQQDIGKLKSDPTTPKKPKDLTPGSEPRVKSAAQAKTQNVVKLHASKAMRNPEHLDTIHGELVNRVGADKAKAIISKIKSHMTKAEDEVEKGDMANAVRGLILTGALATAASHIGPKDTKQNKRDIAAAPKTREEKLEEHNSKVKNPDLMINAKKYGYDERKPNAKRDFMANREKLKNKMKKALTAGYGGAGAPTNLTGGGVLQPESMDEKVKNLSLKSETTDGFSYITCDNCGHEQIYMDHQVKCRSCKKNFALSKLENKM